VNTQPVFRPAFLLWQLTFDSFFSKENAME
jgi:hypothetical protein